jgi:hypothetical protein
LTEGIVVVFNDLNGVGIKTLSIVDATPEFDLFFNGTAITSVGGIGAPVEGRVNTFKYAFNPNTAFPAQAGILTVQFRAQSFTDNSGIGNFAETEVINVVANVNDPLPPLAQLASPANGEAITVLNINAKRFIDVTYFSQNGDPIDKTSLTDAGPEFRVFGPGVADLLLDANGAPIIVGAPLLLSGTDAAATSVTYRAFPQGQGPEEYRRSFPGRGRHTRVLADPWAFRPIKERAGALKRPPSAQPRGPPAILHHRSVRARRETDNPLDLSVLSSCKGRVSVWRTSDSKMACWCSRSASAWTARPWPSAVLLQPRAGVTRRLRPLHQASNRAARSRPT